MSKKTQKSKSGQISTVEYLSKYFFQVRSTHSLDFGHKDSSTHYPSSICKNVPPQGFEKKFSSLQVFGEENLDLIMQCNHAS